MARQSCGGMGWCGGGAVPRRRRAVALGSRPPAPGRRRRGEEWERE